MVLYALHSHCGSQLNAQRWLNHLPALCKAGHEVAARPADWACSLCGCAARWEPEQDATLRQSMVHESEQSQKEEVEAGLQRVLAERGKEAVELRRWYLQSAA